MYKRVLNNRGKHLSSALSMMNFQLYLLAALAGVLMHIASSETIPAVEREESSETERIVGGKDAATGQFPYAISLFKNGRFICTASIIGPTTVLTAAHCVVTDGQTEKASDFHAIANVKKSSPTVRIDFVSITPHPEYSESGIKNDIAIFKTKGAIPFSNTVGSICIAASGTPPMEYTNATAMGWGDTTRLRAFPPDNLKYVDQTIITNERCRLSYFLSTIEDYKICAGELDRGICSGDSGGPLVHLSSDKVPIQLGVASYINGITGCAFITNSVWTRVSSFNSFIMEVAAEDQICEI